MFLFVAKILVEVVEVRGRRHFKILKEEDMVILNSPPAQKEHNVSDVGKHFPLCDSTWPL